MVEFREISQENVLKIIHLEVKEHQKDQVAPNAVSIAQGCYDKRAWFRAIYVGEEPVGFIMLYIEEKVEYGVWRFMIDKNHQGKGYGAASLQMAIDYMKTLPGIKEISLQYVPKEKDGADGFYKKIGFVDTGVVKGKEVIMVYKL